MANISVRQLDDLVYEQLRERAKTHGVSMEEEVRRILLQAVIPAKKLSDLFKEHFGINNGVELTLPKREKGPPVNFEEN